MVYRCPSPKRMACSIYIGNCSIYIVLYILCHVGITINHPPVITIDSWYVYHSQTWVVYGIVIPTLWKITSSMGKLTTSIAIFHSCGCKLQQILESDVQNLQNCTFTKPYTKGSMYHWPFFYIHCSIYTYIF